MTVCELFVETVKMTPLQQSERQGIGKLLSAPIMIDFSPWLKLRPHYGGEIWKRCFHFENTSNVFRPHHTGEIWKRCFHLENTSNVFRPHYVEKIWKRNNHRSFGISVWGKSRQGNHLIIVTPSFSKASFSKCFPSTLKRKAGVFKFHRFRDGLLWMVSQ